MFDIKINDDQKKHAWALVNKVNYGQRSYGNGSKFEQYVGKLGEVVMADVLGVERPDDKSTGYDKGIDFVIQGRNVDLKSMPRDYPVNPRYFICNLRHCQVHNPQCETDVYCFASINKQTSVMTFIGFLKKWDIPEDFLIPAGTIRHKGKESSFVSTMPNYEIPVNYLFQVNSSTDLRWAIDRM